MLSSPWFTVAKFAVPALFLTGGAFWVADSLIDHGKAKVQEKWDADVQAHEDEIERLKNEIAQKERAHRAAIQEVKDRLGSAELRYAADLATLRGSYAGKLRESEDRAAVYERLSEAGATERANLASYAAQLDRSLVEGRQVVGELRATVVQRDSQLRALGEQLRADRELIGVHETPKSVED